MIVRMGLVFLLPLIAVAIYIEGQSFDPDLLDFSKPPGGAMAKLFPDRVDGFTRAPSLRVYNRDNLFEYVNGHAEFFISSGFKELVIADYMDLKGQNESPAYTVDIYDMGGPANAFGVMATEGSGMEPAPVGFMGYGSPQAVLFILGNHYVKIASFEKGGQIMKMANAVASSMGDLKTELPQFARFPKDGALPAGRGFVKSDYMGLEFLNDVYEQRYLRGVREFTAFLVTPNKGSEGFIKLALESLKSMDSKVVEIASETVTGWHVSDPYEGEWSFARTGDGFIGVKDLDGKAEVEAFLSEAIRDGEK